MSGRKSSRIKTLHIVLVVYIISFSVWWTYLLLSKNNDSYNTKIELLKSEMTNKGTFNLATFEAAPKHKELIKKKKSQQRMILAEALVYFVILLVGVWLVYRSFKQEIILAQAAAQFPIVDYA